MTAETVEIKKEIGVDKSDGSVPTKRVAQRITAPTMDGSARKVMDTNAAARAAKRSAERKEILQKQLQENTAKRNAIKKRKIQ